MKLVKAEILTIGDEILFGQIVDTNSQWISSELDTLGIKTVRKTTVADIETEILEALDQALSRADIVLITGGLGPTKDDLTKPCLAKYFDCELVLYQQALDDLYKIFDRLGREMTETNRQQAYLPSKCSMITNRAGTAPGMWFQENQRVVVSMPGVPHEMKIMMTELILPKLQSVFKTPVIYHRLIKTIGIGESWLSDKISPWEEQLPAHIKLAYLPGLGEVKLRLTAIGNDLESLKQEVSVQILELSNLAGSHIYGFDKDTLPLIIGNILIKKGLTLSVAESCSGGSVASALTGIPGSSRYFAGAVVAYHNRIKEALLGVANETLTQYGAVSEQTIVEMAQGVRAHLQTDIGLATSGIAGPDGGTEEKPVGTIWIACADHEKTITKRLSLYKDRLTNIDLTTQAVLNLLRQRLLEMDGEKV